MRTSVCLRIVVLALGLLLVLGPAGFAEVPSGLLWAPGDAGSPVVALNGIVSSSDPLASQAGVEVLMNGGNAVDAAVAVAAAIGVTSPAAGGIFGVGYAVIYSAEDDKVYVADFNGETPMAVTPETFTVDGWSLGSGPNSITVPGSAKGWAEMVDRFGNLTLAESLAPAIRLAGEGYPLTASAASGFNGQANQFATNEPWLETFYAKGEPYVEGDLMQTPQLAEIMRRMGSEGVDFLYTGDVAEKTVDYLQSIGGLLTMEDLARYEVQWKEPIHITYRGYDVYGAPPTASSITWMQTLKILEGYDLASLGHNSAEYLHTITEAHKRAHWDGYVYIADPNFVDVPADRLLSDEYAELIRSQINPDSVWLPELGLTPLFDGMPVVADDPTWNSTTHFNVIDGQGNMVALTHTHGGFYGSGVVVPGTGLVINNGMSWFYTGDHFYTPGEQALNIVEGGKRNRWTLSPGIVLKDRQPFLAIGGAGGDVTQFGITQPILNMIEFGMNVEAALAAPRAVWASLSAQDAPNELRLDGRIPDSVRDALEQLGHPLIPRVVSGPLFFGSAARPFGGGTTAVSASGALLFGAGNAAGY